MIRVEMQGGSELLARFAAYKAGLELVGIQISYEIAKDIEIIAKDLVAVDTGKTKANIKAQRGDRGAMVVATRGGEKDLVPALLEFGTWKMAPRPFMKPAGDLALAAGGVQRAVRTVGGLLNMRI